MAEEKELKEAQLAYSAAPIDIRSSLLKKGKCKMAEAKQLKETLAAYGAVATDLRAPVVLERDGQPVAVVLSFEEYQRLQDIAERERGEAETKWKERFDHLLAEVHSQTARYSSDEIEAEITAAFNEVRKIRYGNRGAD